MREISRFWRLIAGLLSVVMLATMLPAGAIAQVETIHAGINACKTNVYHYQVQLNSHVFYISDDVFPESVTLEFADGSTETALPDRPVNIAGAKYYYFRDMKDVEVVGATTTWDTTAYPNPTFLITARPCLPDPEPEPDPTAVVSGNIVQRGNERPVADLTVCMEELGMCTTTDAAGNFAFGDVPYGTYTLTSDGNNWRFASTTVTVEGDTHLNLIQFKGGGKGK